MAGGLEERLVGPPQGQLAGPRARPARRVFNRELVAQRVGVDRREPLDHAQALGTASVGGPDAGGVAAERRAPPRCGRCGASRRAVTCSNRTIRLAPGPFGCPLAPHLDPARHQAPSGPAMRVRPGLPGVYVDGSIRADLEPVLSDLPGCAQGFEVRAGMLAVGSRHRSGSGAVNPSRRSSFTMNAC